MALVEVRLEISRGGREGRGESVGTDWRGRTGKNVAVLVT